MVNPKRPRGESSGAGPSREADHSDRLREFTALMREQHRLMGVQLEVQRQAAVAQAALAEVLTRQPHAVVQGVSVVEDQMGRVLKEFFSLHPPVFRGGTDPVVADTWLRSVRRLLDTLEISGERRVVLASHLLEGPALFWWDTVQHMRRTDAGVLLWEEFEELFVSKFFPESVRDRMEAEFLALSQGSLSVAEYEARFSELARYAPYLVDTEARRAKRFVHGLRHDIRGQLAAHLIREYGDACNRALAVELEAEESGAARGVQLPPQRALRACFSCGSPRHQKRDCPLRRRRSQPQQSQEVLDVQPLQWRALSPQGGAQPRQQGQLLLLEGVQATEEAVKFCFRCGKNGHSRSVCPWRGRCFSCGQLGHVRKNCPLFSS